MVSCQRSERLTDRAPSFLWLFFGRGGECGGELALERREREVERVFGTNSPPVARSFLFPLSFVPFCSPPSLFLFFSSFFPSHFLSTNFTSPFSGEKDKKKRPDIALSKSKRLLSSPPPFFFLKKKASVFAQPICCIDILHALL